MGIKSKYQVKTRQEVREADLPNLSQELQEIFQDICDAVFVVDPYKVIIFKADSDKIVTKVNKN